MLLDALFPRRCAGCGSGPWPFCATCRSAIVALEPPWCVRCGVPSARMRDGCPHCPPVPIGIARAPFLFDGPVRRAVHRLKFAGWRAVAEALGAAMAEVVPSDPEVVTWVPVSRRRRASRGYDQAHALASVVARRRGLRLARLLVRVADPPTSQARRSGAERRVAMRASFEPVGDVPRRVLLVDDVLTTGATAGACGEQLVAAGAREVSLVTAARAASGAMADLYSRGWLVSGSVVAPGSGSPVVDASRGRSDPRKPTLGR